MTMRELAPERNWVFPPIVGWSVKPDLKPSLSMAFLGN